MHAQQAATVKGTVLIAGTAEPIAGAQVRVQGTRLGTLTAQNGTFTLRVRSANDTLFVARIGYTPATVPLRGQTTVTVNLRAAVLSLSQVVVVGYGTQKRSDITGSVTSVPIERLANVPNTSVTQSLQGAMPGVSVTNTSAGAEPNLDIVVRGQRSISASSSPLVVVDGIPYNGPLSEINPGDVASIEMLKDASAVAIYGARGSNGVVLVTTKRGTEGKAKVSYNGSTGTMKFIELPRVMNATEFAAFKCTRLKTLPTQSCTALTIMTQTELNNMAEGVNTPWATLGTQTGRQLQHDLSVSGGSGDTKYVLGGSLLDVAGVAQNDNFNRATFRLNLDQKITSWLTAGTATQFARTDRSGMPIDFTAAFYQNPLIKPYNADGSLLINPWPEEPINGANPLENLNVIDRNVNNRLFTSSYAQVTVPRISGLTYRLNVGADITNSASGRYWGRNTGTGFRGAGQATQSNTNRNDWTVEHIGKMVRSFGRHNVDVTGLFSIQSTSLANTSRSASGFPNDVLAWRSSLALLNTTNNSLTESKVVSQMGRVNYGYDERYLATFTVRRDGFSGFGANNKYGVFPSVAVAWNVSNEKFFPWKQHVDAFKLRVSSGKNGNQAIQPYQTLSKLADYSYVNGTSQAPGYLPSTLGNPDLKWETTVSTNVGMDLSLYDGRVALTIDRYLADTRDLLLQRSIPSTQGISSIIQNIGKTKNNGWEMQLTTVNLDRAGVKWTSLFNVTLNRNEIVDLYGDGKDDLANQWFIGKPINVNYAYRFGGIWQVADSAAIKTSAQPTAKAGDVKIVDVNGDGKIDATDRTIIGSLEPDYSGGMTNTVSWRGITLSAFLQTVQGVTRQNSLRGSNSVNNNVSRNTVVNTYWSVENPINTYPANNLTSNPLGVQFYEDASFVRLKDLSLSYELPKSLLKRSSLASARIYINGRNLWTKTKWTGMDPELSSQRGTPLERSITSGLSVRY